MAELSSAFFFTKKQKERRRQEMERIFNESIDIDPTSNLTSKSEEIMSMNNNNEEMSLEDKIAKYEQEIAEKEEMLNDDNLSSMEKEMIRSKIRSLNLNITAMKMKNE